MKTMVSDVVHIIYCTRSTLSEHLTSNNIQVFIITTIGTKI